MEHLIDDETKKKATDSKDLDAQRKSQGEKMILSAKRKMLRVASSQDELNVKDT